MSNKYETWYSRQSDAFRQEINPLAIATHRFIDYKLSPINMSELKELDKQHNNIEVRADSQDDGNSAT